MPRGNSPPNGGKKSGRKVRSTVPRPPRPRKPNGRPVLYNPDTMPAIALTVCTEFGATNVQLAKVLGVAANTITDWTKKYDKFREAVKKGKDIFDVANVESSLLQRATGYKYDEIRTEEVLIINGRGKNKITLPALKRTTIRKEVVADPLSCIFWLKNRNPSRWKDVRFSKVDNTHTGRVDHYNYDALSKDELESLAHITRKAAFAGEASNDDSSSGKPSAAAGASSS